MYIAKHNNIYTDLKIIYYLNIPNSYYERCTKLEEKERQRNLFGWAQISTASPIWQIITQVNMLISLLSEVKQW